MDTSINGTQIMGEQAIYAAYERLKQLVEACAEDVAKTAGGNKAAGTRVRKAMQEVKAASQDVRKKVLEDRSQTSPS